MSVAAAQVIVTTNAIKLTTDREPLTAFAPTAPKSAHPVNYFVPNFGLDHDIKNTAVDLDVAEKSVGHNWIYKDPKKAPAGPPTNYFVPDFGVDHDVEVTLKNE